MEIFIEPAFLQALGATVAAVAEGLAITIVIGTVIGLLMGRSDTFDRMIRVYVNGFNALPMIIVLPLFSLWFGYSGAARIATIIFAAIFAITMNVGTEWGIRTTLAMRKFLYWPGLSRWRIIVIP